jgi:hypothetical protein
MATTTNKISGNTANFSIPTYEDEAAMDAAVLEYWGPDDDDDFGGDNDESGCESDFH